MKRVGVVGGGISGLVCAYELAKAGLQVVVHEKEDYLGGHSKTVHVEGFDLDLAFMVFNRVTYPNMMELFESLGVDMELSDMSFAVSLDKGRGCEWGSRNGFSSLFAQKRNLLNPYFWQMVREIVTFKHDVLSYLDRLENNPDIDRNETLGQFVNSRGYSELFQKAYLIPICCSIWSCPSEGVMSFPAFSVLSFCRNHHLLQLFGRPQWLTVKWRSQTYVRKVREELLNKGCHIVTNSEVISVSTSEKGCVVLCNDGSQEIYDGCVMAVHAPDALRILGDEATFDERRILGAFQYEYSDIFLHRDKNLMPKNPAAWSAWNFLGNTDNRVCVTYWLNILQNLGETSLPFLLTLNPDHTPQNTLLKWSTGHPVPSVAASKASSEFDLIQGKRRIWFCGAYQGYGFHEDGLKAGMTAAHGVLGRCCALLSNPKHMVPSWTELGARLFVTRFLKSYISTGCLILLEEGGTMFTFEGHEKGSLLKSVIRVHNPQFYWKVMTQADLGLADAYINGDFSFVDHDEGLFNLFLILIANRDSHNSKLKNRGWWTPVLFTSCMASAKFFMEHVSRKNTLTQARRNISRHYDLSNELFALFLDETMTYSCAVFKNENEDLKDAQMRKISLLIEKARIEKKHEILEMGCGWGSLAIEVVKRTGCKYTGITLSKEQLKFAEQRVRDAGLQDHIKFLLCDYRQLPKTYKYDRIISCEMIEAVGHEYMEEFFGCCESVLANDGLFVLQFISIPDERYDEYRRSSDFIKEYIFPGGCLPSLSRITSAMATTSRFCVEHVENLGIHYYQTLRWWRKNFMERQDEILALGFDEKFIRTWEYYFDYCAAGFKSHTLGNYQGVNCIYSCYEPVKSTAKLEFYDAALTALHGILGKHVAPSWTEQGAQLLVTTFLKSYLSTGCLTSLPYKVFNALRCYTLLEEGRTMFTFEGHGKGSLLKSVIRVYNPQLNWKVLTKADLGHADAYINGDFSFVDQDKGLLNFFLILIVNIDSHNSRLNNRASAKFFIEHALRNNTPTQARRNISRHYDLSNELFALFLDETMTCVVFKNKNEDLKDAQMRKISLLIEKVVFSRPGNKSAFRDPYISWLSR